MRYVGKGHLDCADRVISIPCETPAWGELRGIVISYDASHYEEDTILNKSRSLCSIAIVPYAA